METVDLIYGAEYGRDTLENAAIILDAFHALVDGAAGGHGGGQEDHVLSVYHGQKIVAENHLAVAVELRFHYVEGLMGIHGHDTGCRQLIS